VTIAHNFWLELAHGRADEHLVQAMTPTNEAEERLFRDALKRIGHFPHPRSAEYMRTPKSNFLSVSVILEPGARQIDASD
jgi:hypothetical protein